MKKHIKFLSAIFVAIFSLTALTSCGANFNTIGISFGNYQNGSEVTSQTGNIYYIYSDEIYKTDDINKEGKKIVEGDVSSVNITGEKIYYYDNSISTICKANSEGEKVERIAELYCDEFIVNKDNILASVLTGQGTDDLNDPDNYNIAKLKTTDKKVRNAVPNFVIKKGKLIGSVGDNIYFEKNTEDGTALYISDLDGQNQKKMMQLPEDAKVICDLQNVYLMGTVEGKYGLYIYDGEGKLKSTVSLLTKNPTVEANAFNICDGYIYFENHVVNEDGISDDLFRVKLDSKDFSDVEKVMTNNKSMEYYIASTDKGVMIRAKDAADLKDNPKWKALDNKEKETK